MKPPSAASLRKVTAENLARLGADRLAEILVGVAATRADLKRRLRMELAAEQGPAALVAEIDKRLASFETSRGKITWRQRPAFIRDVDALRELIAERLAKLDWAAAVERLWRFMDTSRQTFARCRDAAGELDRVFQRAAVELGGLLASASPGPAAVALVEAIVRDPFGWKGWLPALLSTASPDLAVDALRGLSELRGAVPGWVILVRHLADASGDLDAYRATWSDDALRTPAAATELGCRYLAAGRVEEAGEVLRAAAPALEIGPGKPAMPDAEWETVWIDYLERAGRVDEAQAVRWASFERTLSVERAKAFISRLADFDDVEAESRALEIASRFPDFEAGLRVLMEWPALGEASRMIEQRGEGAQVAPEAAELWAAKLRRRHPKAAHSLLRRAAATAFRRKEFQTCNRLTAEAEAIEV